MSIVRALRSRLVPLTASAAAVALLAACTAAGPADGSVDDDGPTAGASDGTVAARLADLGLAVDDPRGLVDALDRLPADERPQDLIASVRPDHVLVSVADGEQEVPLTLPDDLFYVSFAPYVDGTHECFYHSLTTCHGELGGQEVDVVLTDEDTGDVLVEETATLYDNGFVGYWLPRGVTATLQVSQGDLSATTTLRTDDDAPTCVTTMQLT